MANNKGAYQEHAIVKAEYQGPLPLPEQLMGYEQVCPGAADRIIKMAEEQAAHRRYLEKITVETQAKNARAGIYCGTFVTFATIVAGAVECVLGNPVQGTAAVVLGTLVPAAVFYYGKRMNLKELIEKQKLLNQMK